MLSSRNKLPTRLRELSIMRLAWRAGAEYAWFQHYRIATQAGITPGEIVAVRDWRKSDLFGAAERAVLAAADDTCERGKISDAVWAECARELKESAVLVEMVVAIGNWTMFAQLLQSLEVEIEEGATPWPPDGKAPSRRHGTRAIPDFLFSERSSPRARNREPPAPAQRLTGVEAPDA
jgi:hypothetical protein